MSEPPTHRHSGANWNPASPSSFPRKRESSDFGSHQEWDTRDFVQTLSNDKPPRHGKLQAREYQRVGKFPVIDQGQSEVAGWTNDESLVISDGLPYIVFGDHTRAFKYVDHPFVLGADGTQLLKPSADYNPRFFYYACLQVDLPSRGYNRHFGFLKEKALPLPPKPEQEKIAAVLWKVQRAIATQDRLIAATRDLKASAMQRLFTHGLHNEPLKDTEIGPMPESWRLKRLREFGQFKNGVNFGRDAKGSGLLTLDVKNMFAEGIYANTEKLYRVNLKSTEDFLLSPNDILFVRSSLKQEGVGWPALFRGAQEPVLYCGFLIRLRLSADELNPFFLLNFLRQPHIRSLMVSQSGKVAITNISQEVLGNLSVAVPNLDEQRAIAAALATIDRKLAHHRKKRAALNDLFQTLLHKLMTAEIRVNNLDIDTSEVTDHFVDANKMIGKPAKSASAEHFPNVREMALRSCRTTKNPPSRL